VIDRVVALGGPPGSGKTTAARRLAAELGLKLVNAGERFRAEAARRGMDLSDFSEYAEAHPEVDRELDDAMAREATPGRLLEGRVQGPLLRRDRVPVHLLSVVARAGVRAGRIAQRDGLTVEVARAKMLAREASERARYRAIYGLDLDREEPDLTVDSSDRTPEEVVALLVQFLGARGAVHVR
jgi:CMP/dCMP kinase